MKVALFITCLVDQLCPNVGVATVKVLEKAGCEVIFDERQTCCGQPAFNTGYRKEARQFAKRFIEIFEHSEVIVSPSGSCVAMVKHFTDLFSEDEIWRQRAEKVAEKTHELSSFLVNILGIENVEAKFKGRVTWHDACHGLRDLGIQSEPRQLLKNVKDAEFVELQNSDACCGFGGTFSIKYPEISVAILEQKIEAIELSKAEFVVSGDAKMILAQWLRETENTVTTGIEDWWSQIRGWQNKFPLRFETSEDIIKPQLLCQTLARLTNNDAIISTDVGQHQMWLAQYYGFKRMCQSLTSGGLGTMGFGLPAGLGAQIGLPDQQVIAFVGDGGFQMTSQELATAVQYRTNLKVIVMNNSHLGMVRQWQELLYDGNYSEVNMMSSPDFVKLAEAYGAKGLRAEHPEELEDILREGLESKGVVVMDIRVAPEECVFPMIEPGKGLKEMRLQ